MNRYNGRNKLHLLIILLAALALRLLLWSLPLHLPANDEHEYIRVANDLLAGQGWQFYEQYHWLRAPLYPLWLAGSLALVGGNLKLAALPNIALSTLNVFLIFLLTYELVRLSDKSRLSAPLIAAGLAAMLFTMATFASLYMLETLFTTLLSATLLALLRWQRRPSLWLAALAGALLGLTALTRSLALPLLPLAVGWMLCCRLAEWPRGPERRPYIRLATTITIFSVACMLVIAPWTIRNYRAYGRFILVETGLSFNVWAFNEPREDMATIFRELEQIANPAERSDYATAKGMARLREDPAILLRKLDDNWFALWRVKPIEDRFLQQNYYSDVSLGYFLAALAFDDALVLLILVAAAWGLAMAPGWQARLLLGGWLVALIASVLLTHGEARYRHAILPVLIPYAAWALAALSASRTLRPNMYRLQTGLGIICSGIMAWTFLTAYPWEWTQQRLARVLLQLSGDVALLRGDSAGAIAAYIAAAEAQPDSVDALIRVGQSYASQGDQASALEFYRRAWRLRPTYIPASTGLGDLLRLQGDDAEAREAFAGSYASAQEISDWAWQNLSPPPVERIDIGNGLDFGYVGGVYPAELQQGKTARWTNGVGLFRIPAGSSRLLRIRLAAPHPNNEPVAAQLCAARSCQQLRVTATWRTYMVLLPATPSMQQVVQLHSDTFVGPQDSRQLGLLIDWLSATPLQPS